MMYLFTFEFITNKNECNVDLFYMFSIIMRETKSGPVVIKIEISMANYSNKKSKRIVKERWQKVERR